MMHPTHEAGIQSHNTAPTLQDYEFPSQAKNTRPTTNPGQCVKPVNECQMLAIVNSGFKGLLSLVIWTIPPRQFAGS